MNSMAPSEELVRYNGESSYRTVLKNKKPNTHGFAPAMVLLTLPEAIVNT